MVKKIVLILLAISSIVGLCYINATMINTKQISYRQETIKSDKINEEVDGLCIAYFSDLYYGKYLNNEDLDKVIEMLDNFKPDILLFGGDLLDSSYSLDDQNRQYLISKLSSIDAKYGKYAVLGDNDTYSDTLKQEMTSLLEEANFKILNNSNTTININKNEYINLIGLENYVYGNIDYNDSFFGINSNKYTIVLSHCPDTYDQIQDYNFDYMLAGHSRGGQVYIPLIEMFNRDLGSKNHVKGKYTKQGRTLDITNGIGYAKYKARFYSDSEIVIYTLKSSNKK